MATSTIPTTTHATMATTMGSSSPPLSLWENISEEDKDAILQIYDENQVPIEVREHLDSWIEYNLVQPSCSSPRGENQGTNDGLFGMFGLCSNGGRVENGHDYYGDTEIIEKKFCTELINQVKLAAEKMKAEPNQRADLTLVPAKLKRAARKFESLPPQWVYQRFHCCLREEYKIIQKAEQAHQARQAFQNLLDPAEAAGGFDQETKLAWLNLTQEVQGVVTFSQDFDQKIQSMNDYCGQNDTNQCFVAGSSSYPYHYPQPETVAIVLDVVARAIKMATDFNTIVTNLVTNFTSKLKWSELSLHSPHSPITVGEMEQIFSKLFAIWHTYQNTSLPSLIGTLQKMGLDTSQPFNQYCGKQIHDFHQFNGKMKHHCDTLLKNVLVVHVQPPRVIQKDKLFDTAVQFLYHHDFTQIPANTTTSTSTGGDQNPRQVVEIFVISERQAADLFKNCRDSNDNINLVNRILLDGDTVKIQTIKPKTDNSETSKRRKRVTPLKILAFSSTMEFSKLKMSGVTRKDTVDLDKSTKDVSSSSSPASSSTVKPKTKVSAVKQCLLYLASFQINGVPCQAWCCSLPFTFIQHTNQNHEATGAIFWDDVAKEPGRLPFDTKENVAWLKFARHLNDYMRSVTDTQWKLTLANLHCIRDRLMTTTGADQPSNSEVSLSPRFHDDQAIPRHAFFDNIRLGGVRGGFLFWDWFVEVVRLIRKHLKTYWDSGLIVGFIDRAVAEEMVINQSTKLGQNGTFILRFSDTYLGGITLTYHTRKSDGTHYVNSLTPFTIADLTARSLADRIYDFNEVQHVLYYTSEGSVQSMEKGRAFPTLLDQVQAAGTQPGSRGYLGHGIQMVVQSNASIAHGIQMVQSNASTAHTDQQQQQPLTTDVVVVHDVVHALPSELASMDFHQMMHEFDDILTPPLSSSGSSYS